MLPSHHPTPQYHVDVSSATYVLRGLAVVALAAAVYTLTPLWHAYPPWMDEGMAGPMPLRSYANAAVVGAAGVAVWALVLVAAAANPEGLWNIIS